MAQIALLAGCPIAYAAVTAVVIVWCVRNVATVTQIALPSLGAMGAEVVVVHIRRWIITNDS